MSYIRINSNGVVVSVYNYPLHPIWGLGKTEDELLKEGYFIDNIPQADTLEGKCAVMMYNAETNNLYYEYIDEEPTPKTEMELTLERIASLEQSNAELTTLIATMTAPTV